MERFPLIKQRETMDCGPTCLKMVCASFGCNIAFSTLRQLCGKGQQGVNFLAIHRAAEHIGLRSSPIKVNKSSLVRVQTPCIAHWENNHFVVVYKITKNKVFVADPAIGKLTFSHEEFAQGWLQDKDKGFLILLEATPKLLSSEIEEPEKENGLVRIYRYLVTQKELFRQLWFNAILTTFISFLIPFITQNLIDKGINSDNLNFIYLILAAQAMLVLSRIIAEFIRGWIVAHLGTRVNIAVISDFLSKLMKLPSSYFNTQNAGDIIQRIADHKKIEVFLTSHTINVLVALLNIIGFSILLAMYSISIFYTFLFGSSLAIFWTTLFLKRRRNLDVKTFNELTKNHSNILQIIDGIHEIKLNQANLHYMQKWQRIQGNLFNLKLNGISLEQYQQAGTFLINEIKNIIILLISAQLVLEGEMTLGMMMAVIYILGQMHASLEQIVLFIPTAQDAKISIERLSEIQDMPEEVKPETIYVSNAPSGPIELTSMSFKYDKHNSENVLDELNLLIPHKKTTAIVGASGSGKTTLMKLLLNLDSPDTGKIQIGEQNLTDINPEVWRRHCGVVMQDGFIFNDSIMQNIAPGIQEVDVERLAYAAKTANIQSEIERLPNNYNTVIGKEGLSLSGGQHQRILIARAVYKQPDYLFFDEATSALDASNEKTIKDNLKYFFKGRTVVIIAHRLSTVKNADQIIVLDKGKIAETGSHETLAKSRGIYFQLIKDQLSLGN